MNMNTRHDIIDRSTGNIVGCIFFAPAQAPAVISDLMVRLASLTRLVDQLEDTSSADLEDVVSNITDKHCLSCTLNNMTNPYTTLRPRTRPYVVPKPTTKGPKGLRPKKARRANHDPHRSTHLLIR